MKVSMLGLSGSVALHPHPGGTSAAGTAGNGERDGQQSLVSIVGGCDEGEPHGPPQLRCPHPHPTQVICTAGKVLAARVRKWALASSLSARHHATDLKMIKMKLEMEMNRIGCTCRHLSLSHTWRYSIVMLNVAAEKLSKQDIN
ncbi:hypothetical protein EVG20_g9067 [Dentipellis fragilis]|uniref:Uncharacterized protein n=1 Tax=Dentipellis fragilis TaxID=205917 RepID=A0A4Y9Y0X7_9AGAM|nr:hypothetical protein EVG20_g9067 [Dentipellis fragilis]